MADESNDASKYTITVRFGLISDAVDIGREVAMMLRNRDGDADG